MTRLDRIFGFLTWHLLDKHRTVAPDNAMLRAELQKELGEMKYIKGTLMRCREVLLEAKSGLMAFTGGYDGACGATIARIDQLTGSETARAVDAAAGGGAADWSEPVDAVDAWCCHQRAAAPIGPTGPANPVTRLNDGHFCEACEALGHTCPRHRLGGSENTSYKAPATPFGKRKELDPVPGNLPMPGAGWCLYGAKISNPPAPDDVPGVWLPPGHPALALICESPPRPQEARANAWKTHEADTLRFAISYALQTSEANGGAYALKWLRAWSEGDPRALAELRAAIGHGEI